MDLYLVSFYGITLTSQVIASKTKIYIVLEFVDGGKLSDKIVLNDKGYDGAKKLIALILDPNSLTRITIPEILSDEWFKKGYRPPFLNTVKM
ncbi:hypothetical protein ZIOFF_044174 [Zingiber officinale]|uniref:Protein kinase domain-containing protein n=1 Tax=Zingiber officinale TaxID=94328 RepID=A0A8J5KR19_ZINOF|nr:hypothetical protein ZIOFF_044174 [Zingiber officinale]